MLWSVSGVTLPDMLYKVFFPFGAFGASRCSFACSQLSERTMHYYHDQDYYIYPTFVTVYH